MSEHFEVEPWVCCGGAKFVPTSSWCDVFCEKPTSAGWTASRSSSTMVVSARKIRWRYDLSCCVGRVASGVCCFHHSQQSPHPDEPATFDRAGPTEKEARWRKKEKRTETDLMGGKYVHVRRASSERPVVFKACSGPPGVPFCRVCARAVKEENQREVNIIKPSTCLPCVLVFRLLLLCASSLEPRAP